jgi:hypothetical protein
MTPRSNRSRAGTSAEFARWLSKLKVMRSARSELSRKRGVKPVNDSAKGKARQCSAKGFGRELLAGLELEVRIMSMSARSAAGTCRRPG